MAEKLNHCLESNSLLPPSQFSCRRGLKTCDALLTVSHRSQVSPDRGMEGRLVQLDFSDAFHRVTHRGLLYKLKSIGVGGHFLSIVSEFISDRRQRARLDFKVCASVNVVSGVPLRVVF